MTQADKLIVHIGLPKTATTTLQEGAFTKLHKKNLINYLGRANDSEKNIYFQGKKIAKCLCEKEANVDIVGRDKTITTVYSNEGITIPMDELVKSPFGGRAQLDIAKRIKKLFSQEFQDIQIVLVIRSQGSMIQSFYTQMYFKYNKYHHTNTLTKYIEYIFKNPKSFDVWNYDRTVENYIHAFGPKNVHVFFYEDFLNDKSNFIIQLAEVIDVDEKIMLSLLADEHYNKKNQNMNGTETTATRVNFLRDLAFYLRELQAVDNFLVNHPNIWRDGLFRKLYHRLVYKPSDIPPLNKEQKSKIYKYYKESNIELANKLNVDKGKLKKYGYI